MIKEHNFTSTIRSVLEKNFGTLAPQIFEASPLLQYLNEKTRSANRSSKARAAFANHYALYVLIEDYINKGFALKRTGEYDHYEGARFTDLLRRQRELPFGAKLQNHALNSRLNDEFSKYFPILGIQPILRDQKLQRYWITEQLLQVRVVETAQEQIVNIAESVLQIIDLYVQAKLSAFDQFLETCRKIAALSISNAEEGRIFIGSQLQPNVDARIFEIVSYAILKAHYGDLAIYWGWTDTDLRQEYLALYKTGRTNANDGGIDFVMKPLGRFFQVTETIDVNKYFLDIDKVQRFPMTFVVKTSDSAEWLRDHLREQAKAKYRINAVVERYIEAIEEIINIPKLLDMFYALIKVGHLSKVMSEIVLQSQLEFNYNVNEEQEENDISDSNSNKE